MGNLLTQSLKILKQAAVEQGKDYMSNTVSLVNDAAELRSEVMKTGKNSVDTLKNMKRGFNFRMIHDWFYQKESEYDDSGSDDFDAGFDTGVEEDTDSTILDRDAMKKISSNQSSMMLQIGAKQAETTMASTAEIVTTINQRSSEILSSVNNINTTLLGISKKLDAFASVVEAEKTEQAKQSLYDNQGRLSLQSIYQTAKNSGGGLVGDVASYAGFIPLLTKSSPAELLQAIYGMSGIGDKDLNILGGRSINKTMEHINDTIGEAVQRGLEDLISSKTFKNLFGDLKRGEANHNYGEDVVKGFNNKQATFDGYVRTTIIKTIPEYLRVIAKGITGINYNVGKDGSLSQGTRMSSKMNDEQYDAWKRDEDANSKKLSQEKWGDIAKQAFKSNGLSWSGRDALYEGRTAKNLDRTEMTLVANTLNGVCAELIGLMNSNRLEPAMLQNSTFVEKVIDYTARILQASMGNKADWRIVVREAITTIAYGDDARRFCNGVNNTYKQLHVERTEYGASGSAYSSLAGYVDMEQTISAATSQNKRTIENKTTINEIDDIRRKLDEYKRMSAAEKANFLSSQSGVDKLSYVRNLNDKLEELEKKLRGTYGSGNAYNQTAFGNYLNIDRNGCGPVALAEMLARRGMYNPSHGMNVGSFMNASAMMGYPLSAGNVTNMTLRSASGNNPITVLGSGPDFGTAHGNNHFMNVIGSDGHGNVYVMNPIDGKVHRRSINDVASSSLVGLYGGGIGDRIKTRISNRFNEFMNSSGEELYERASDYIGERFSQSSDKVDQSLRDSLRRAQKYGESRNISDEDRNQMNLVMSMMETSAEDGDSGPDKQAIMMEISRIKDQKLKTRLRIAVSGMIDRQSSKKESGGILGKLLTAGKGILKNFFAPLIAGVTSVIKSVAKAAKKFLSPIIKYFKEQMKKNLGKIGTGAKQVWEGTKELFSRDSETPRQPGRIRQFINNRRQNAAVPTVSSGGVGTATPTMESIEVPQSTVNTQPIQQPNVTPPASLMPSLDGSVPTTAATNAVTSATTTAATTTAATTMAATTAATAAASATKLGGIKKILGGMGGILAGIAGILFNIFMGVNGFKALFKTVSTVVKSIAKSFNGLFKSLNKTLKPVLKILTKSLTEIVKSVTGIIAPVLEGLSPILTTLGEVVSNVLTPLTPILEFIGKAVGKITSFILKPIEWIANGIKWITTKFAKGFGQLIHPFNKKNRAQYYKSVGLTDDGEDKESAEKKKNADAAYRNLSSDEKDKIAEKYSKLIHPFSKEKRQDLYEKMMSGEVTEDDAKKMFLKRTTAPTVTIGKDLVDNIKSGVHNKLTAGSKDEVANRLAKLIYPLDKTKRGEIYDKIMSGQLSVDEAEKMVKRKALDRATTVVAYAAGGPLGVLAKEGVSRTGIALLNYFKKRDTEVDEANKKRDEKQDSQFEENKKLQISIFKNGALQMLTGIRSISDTVDFVKGSGISLYGMAEAGIGGLLGGTGRLITAIGELASYLPFVDENNKIALLGESLLETSDKLTSDGAKQLVKGLNLMKLISTDFGDSSAGEILKNGNSSANSISSSKKKTSNTSNTYGGRSRGSNQSYYSEGDIPYSNASMDVIGSGDAQSSFGNYLNMARRGCGPVALADAYNRRTGSNINARNLAVNMTANGTYSPSSGTSVGGFVNAANSLGMGTRVGGVTMSSLKRATPNNPITLVGSGVEFGTRNGNNHYLNAIGTDRYGGVYVSNPMTGRIQRRYANSLASSSVLGIYGSGDISDSFGFSDDTKEKMSELLSLTGIFGKLFQTDNSDVDDIAESAEKDATNAKVAKGVRENYSDEEYQEKVLQAMTAFKGDNPIHDGETLDEYEKRITNAWNNNKATRNKYIAMVGQAALNNDVAKQYNDLIANSSSYYQPYVEYKKDADGNILHDESGNPIIVGGFKYLLEDENSDYVKSKKASIAIKKLGEVLTAAGSAATTAATGTSGTTSGLVGNTSDIYEAASQVWEGAAKKLGAIYSYGNHGPITTRSGATLEELHPDCSGMISAAMNYMGYTFKGTMNGSNRRWTTHDISGKTKNDLIYNSDGTLSSDWEFIPYSADKVQPGDILTTPSHVGLYVRGNSANAYGFDAGDQDAGGARLKQLGTGAAKAYLDKDANWQDYLKWTMGPGYGGLTTILRYVGGSTGSGLATAGLAGLSNAQGKIALSKAMQNATPQWKYYPDKLTKGGYWDQAKKAGFTTAQTAMVAAIGIHENGAKKLTGEESLTRVVWDNIGKQYAFGLMNWIPDAANSHSGANETKYGTTLADQLKYIKEAYFSPTSTYDRAKNVNFNRYYGAAMKEALGYAPKLGQGDRWGPYAETDLAEAMGHYVGNALVPYDFNRTSGQARHMRTAVEAYNWMLDNGQTGYAASAGSGGAATIAGGLNLASMLGDYANDLPDYYKNMLGAIQTTYDNSAAASSSYDSYGDYSYGDYEDGSLGDAETLEGDTRKYATASERNQLYTTTKKNHSATINWSNTQLTSKGYGDVYLYLDHDKSSKITCKLANSAKYAKVTTWGSWYFVYAGYDTSKGALCGWAPQSDFSLTSDVKSKAYQTSTVNSTSSASDAMYNLWKNSSDNLKFFKYTGETDATGQRWQSYYRDHWFTAKGPYKGKYKEKQTIANADPKKGRAAITGYVDAPYYTFSQSYDKTYKNVNRDIIASKVQSKSLAELRKTIGACGDVDYNSPDGGGFYIPGNILGSGDTSIPPLDNNAFDVLSDYGYDNSGSYTVNNYTIQGGINNATADLSRAELLNYLVGTEFTTRSPRTERLLNKILNKLENLGTTSGTTTNTNSMYEDEIPEVIANLVRG